jgi:RNA polymerase sigma-70 factor (ECF subfamily)
MPQRYTFNDFLKEHVGTVTLYTKATCGIHHLVDDIVQETFIRAWRYYPTLRAESSSRSWIISICRNTIIDMSKKWPPHDEIEQSELADSFDAFHQNDLLSLMQSISSDQREVLVLCGLLGYDYETAAEIVHVPVGTVRSRLARARDAMAVLLDESARVDETGTT